LGGGRKERTRAGAFPGLGGLGLGLVQVRLGHVFRADLLAAAVNRNRAEVGDSEFGGAGVALTRAVEAGHRRDFLQHVLEDVSGLEGNFSAFFRGRAAEDVDADFNEADVGFLVFGVKHGLVVAKVEEAEDDEHGGREADEVERFAFVKGLDFAGPEGVVETQDFAGAVEARGARVGEAAVGLRLQHEGEMEVDADLVVDHLRHNLLAELARIAFQVREELGVLKPCRVELLPEVLEFLVDLQGPGEGLLGNALIAIDDFAGDHGQASDEENGGEMGARWDIRDGEVAVRVGDAVGQPEEEREEAVAVVERPPDGFVGGRTCAFAVKALTC
jgi:hypothetical protein